jgi:hypothetical protein
MEQQRIAHVIIPGAKPGQRIAYVTFREDGYTPTVYDDDRFTQDECERIVAELKPADRRHVFRSPLHAGRFNVRLARPRRSGSYLALQPSRIRSNRHD